MTRRVQIGRARDATNAEAVPRELGGSQIFCYVSPAQNVTNGEDLLVGPITLAAGVAYQRIFVAATIAAVTVTDE